MDKNSAINLCSRLLSQMNTIKKSGVVDRMTPAWRQLFVNICNDTYELHHIAVYETDSTITYNQQHHLMHCADVVSQIIAEYCKN